ncbi:Taurine catabolism dioxygenase TauD/TfdA [Trichormus variabilis ATCC 29413]|uniref:Taurine catabolism dioxygenase TauD/TfdA n=2 Tax=Anabaena variabilis TaxID=264691 RepID=Q3MA90_TRIV2|nr:MULTISPECIES: TauD/TfdA family dioxygenase [Nostocaceae]ABA22096.1 Taurine catabolism dioxygenase TauD/TfdA [Trichormus variabilis ATCC 29413]MBC1217467.1 TauD/TfdA family dioxygenase [Trichormus variabilis ARAD]MBC1257993.1 TauD/TfdA family dioxygenase [Trichormus variabilis V5]MBC1270252.1 TauD/TfdA family dioxygenase [Trichormus variabilis FSR]MBC1304012.1 TauD/TfdA family dioxygenase [Trichormus variabilis N2B]
MGYKHIEVKPVSGFIGAEIGGVDLSTHLQDETIQEIRKALLKWKVVFFRNQNIDHAAQIAFTGRFGEVTYAHPHEDEPIEGYSQILPIDRSRYERRNGLRRSSYESRWHTDVTAAINPPAGSILRAVNVPSIGGDTQWTNLVAAYEGLSAPVRELADKLKAEHRFNARLRLPSNSKIAQRIAANPIVSIHPVVRVHPETGERALFVNPGFTSHILDVSPQESELLLELFFNQITKPAYTTRFRWNNGDIAFWDNRATAHLAPQDLDHLEVERVLYRTTITGDVPVGVNGFRSEIVEGELFTSELPNALKNKVEKVAQPVLS